MGKIKICQGRDDSGVDVEHTGKKKKQSERVTGELGRKAIHRNIHRNIRETG